MTTVCPRRGDPAVMLADGGEAIRDLAVPRDQGDVFGPVASTSTAWPVPAGVTPGRHRPAAHSTDRARRFVL
ncbi:hypothetical protein [Kitasatospora sp. NPDC050463]|uniref:hypothetical protein n=1 Tax=Kitasatospora sp. NPDC050463 TaxID=3155786 RepID=UPI0033D5A59C